MKFLKKTLNMLSLAIIILTLESSCLAKELYVFYDSFDGNVAKIEDHPYTVTLGDFDNFIWGGVIISEYYVLTSARCIDKNLTSKYQVRNGTNYFNNGDPRRGHFYNQVEKTIIHDKFHYNSKGFPVNDIALVKVRQPYSQQIKLSDAKDPVAGDKANVTGWGIIEGSYISDNLRFAQVEIIDKNIGQSFYKEFLQENEMDDKICVGGFISYKHFCATDIGGPLMVNNTLVGITTSVDPDGLHPAIFTSVGYHFDWIKKQIEK